MLCSFPGNPGWKGAEFGGAGVPRCVVRPPQTEEGRCQAGNKAGLGFANTRRGARRILPSIAAAHVCESPKYVRYLFNFSI